MPLHLHPNHLRVTPLHQHGLQELAQKPASSSDRPSTAHKLIEAHQGWSGAWGSSRPYQWEGDQIVSKCLMVDVDTSKPKPGEARELPVQQPQPTVDRTPLLQ